MKNQFQPTETALTQGQSLRTHVPAGTHLVVLHGEVHLERSCAWLGNGFANVGTTLCEGQIYSVDQAGWISVLALSPAQVLQHVPASPLAQTARALGAYVRRALHWTTPDAGAEAKPTL